jgi:hypothetical protein
MLRALSHARAYARERAACLALSLAAISACGAGDPEQLPARKMTFSLDQSGCAPAKPVDAAEILLVDAARICVHQRLSLAAPGTQIAKGVAVEAGQRYDLVVQLFCGGDRSCPCCFAQQSILIADQASVTVLLGPAPGVGPLCIPPITATLDCPQ